ncbi:MAG: hypothetical protein ACK4OE_02780 [Acidovorax sp.]|uniref:hypothetical protein n=1 Tax=Acidovorax sp. TaxID=1872122 RepID=UPI003919172E
MPSLLHALARSSPATAWRFRAIASAMALLVGTSVHSATPLPDQTARASSPPGDMPGTSIQPTRLESAGAIHNDHRSLQLVFSPKGDRFAHVHDRGLELWQSQPLKRLTSAPETSGLGIRQVQFNPHGQLNYIDGRKHAWITPDLQRGMGGKADLISPDGRYAVRTGLREGEDGFAPQFYNATSDVYDLQEQRSVCQFPAIGWVTNAAFTADWFAVQLAFTGPQPPKPLALCEMATGRALIMPFGDARTVTPTLDPQGRWLMVHASGSRLLGLSDWQESKLFALPLAESAFAKNPNNEPYPCAELPCGQPASALVATLPKAKPGTSPDGNWLAEWGSDQTIRMHKSPDMQQVATLAHGPYQGNINQSTGGRRAVFSANSRWMGLQAGRQLYRVDLHSNPLRLQELTPPPGEFDLQGVSSDGHYWLVLHSSGPNMRLQGALWHAKP